MKRAIFIFLVFFAAAYGVFAQNGVIREMSGDVTLKLTGAADFIPAQTGDAVAQDTIVSTGFKSSAVIAIGSSTITVRPLTRLSLSEIRRSADTEDLNIKLHTGRVRVDVKPPVGAKANTTIQSSAVTASVRGTSFEFDTASLDVIEGRVAFSGDSGMVTMVQGGESSFVGTDGQPLPPAAISAAALLPSAPVGSATEAPAQPVSQPSTGRAEITIDWE